MTDPGKSSSSIRRKAKEKKVSPFAKVLWCVRLVAWVLLCVAVLSYAGFFLAVGRGRVPFMEGSATNIALLALPVIALFVYLLLRERNKSEVYGKKLYAKGSYAKARRVLERTPEHRSAEASKIMGDMYIAGLGGTAEPERAVECYTAALKRFGFEDLYFGPEEASEEWLEDVLARIRPLVESGLPDALELAVTLSQRLGRDEEALACARRLPDDDGKPGWQTECLISLISEARTADGAEKNESATPDIRVPLTWRSSIAQPISIPFLFAGIALVLFITAMKRPESDFGPYPAPLFLLFLLFAVCCGIVFHRRRKGHYRLGCSALARDKFDLAAQHFSRGVGEFDPRAPKMLGDMRQYGQGFAKDPALAFAGYETSMVLLEVCLFLRAAQKEEKTSGRLLASLFFRSMLPGMPEKEEPALWQGLRQGLSDLVASGFVGDEVCGRLFQTLQKTNDWQAIRRYGKNLPQTLANRTMAASSLIHDPGAGEADVAAGLRMLERCAEEGGAFAAQRLAVHYSGAGPRGEQLEDADKARAYLSAGFATAEALPASERRNAEATAKLSAEVLLDQYGADFLDDDLCLKAMRRN